MSTETDVVTGTVVDGEGGIFLNIGDRQFECRKVSTTWQMMQYAKARKKVETIHVPTHLPEDDPRRTEAEEKRNAAGMDMLALLLETAEVILKPRERESFASYMDELSMSEKGLDQGELEKAISAAISEVGGQGKAGENTSSQSSTTSANTSQNVRVISSNKVTGADALPDVT